MTFWYPQSEAETMSRSRRFCFTLNNPTDSDKPLEWECKFVIFQEESGDAGTTHYQGFVIWEHPKSLAGCKKVNGRAHWEACKGSPDANIAYCTKESTRVAGPWEKGTRPAQGKRSDLEDIAKLVSEGAGIKRIAEEHPGSFIRYHRGIERLRGLFTKPRSEAPDVLWFYGATGTGKSRKAAEIGGDSIYWKDMSDGKWWDGYEQQDVVVFDDMRKDTFKFHELLKLFDRYPHKIQTKGGYTELNSKTIIVTTAFHWRELYDGREDIGQLERRIKKTTHFAAL